MDVVAPSGTVNATGCVRGDAPFRIALFGEEQLAPFSVGADGEITLGALPETTDDEPHILTELTTGASITFSISLRRHDDDRRPQHRDG